jgi:anti-sigma regulatory factor (Ser/Thr protein kinase)
VTHHPDEDTADVLVVRNDLSELARVGAWINAWAEQHGVPARTIERLDLCSTEVVTNIISYGYDDCATHQISLRLDRRGAGLALEIGDDGNAFDPHQADEPRPAANSRRQDRAGGYRSCAAFRMNCGTTAMGIKTA